MAGYIGSKSSVTLVDGYSEAEADAEFVNDPNGAITVSGSNVGIGTSSIATNTKLIVRAATNQNLEVESSSGKLRLSALNDARSANVPLQFTSSSFEFLTGNVGIGTSSISSSDRLSVVGGKIRVSQSIAKSGNSLDNGTYSGITINNSNNANGDLAGISMYPTSQYTAAAGLFGVRESQTAAGLSFWTGSNNGSERMRITSSGNVGIGTSSPSRQLSLSHASQAEISLLSGSDTNGGLIYHNASEQKLLIANRESDGHIAFQTGGTSERMRIDSSGTVLVGTTTSTLYNATSGTGLSYRNGVALDIARENTGAGQPLINLNLTGADGDHLLFYKDGSVVGSIGVVGDSIIFGRGDTALAFNNGLDAVYPINTNGGPRDNAIDLGRSNVRFDDIYATNGTIQTSDFNEKQDIASLTATEMLVGKRISALFKTFRWKDSVAEKGDNARTHTGVIAQDVQAAFTAEGLDAGDYALFISSTWWEHDVDVPAVEAVDEVTDEDGNVTTEAVEAVDAYTRTDTYDTEAEAPEGATSKTRMGIRYPELLSFVAAYNEQRFASIEARLTALEA
jgi:hypothetical protein